MPGAAHSIRFVVRRRQDLGGASEVVPVVDGLALQVKFKVGYWIK